MEQTDLNPNKKGAIGEAIVFGGQKPPGPVSDAVKLFVIKNYDVAKEAPMRVTVERGGYLKVVTDEGETISTRPDGFLEVEWVPADRSDEIDYNGQGRVQNLWELRDRKTVFPVEVKTGEYAELERDQKEVLDTIAATDNQTHPMVIRVSLSGLPDEYGIDTRIL